MKNGFDELRVREGQKIKLARWATRIAPLYDDKGHYQRLLDEQIDQLSELQRLLYASDSYALLLIFQAMDAAGKDGVIRHVMSGINPQGCQVYSFKHPSATDLDHDFLWRTAQCLPERGRIGIFNRSYYEEVLIVRVHPEILRAQRLPAEVLSARTFWQDRFRSIVDHEQHLVRNGTRVIKFFLHLSAEEQRRRFIARIDEPEKNWKFSSADIDEREYWDDYMRAYESCLSATSTNVAPWHVVPADDKLNARLIVASVVVRELRRLKMSYPVPDAARRRELQAIRRRLSAARQPGTSKRASR